MHPINILLPDHSHASSDCGSPPGCAVQQHAPSNIRKLVGLSHLMLISCIHPSIMLSENSEAHAPTIPAAAVIPPYAPIQLGLKKMSGAAGRL